MCLKALAFVEAGESILNCPLGPRGESVLYTSASLELDQVGIGELSGVTQRVEPGEVVCLSGPSGSGKTRLLRAIADLDPHDGAIRLGSLDQTTTPAHEWRRAVALVPAESQWWSDRVGEHFERRMDEALEALGFPPEVVDWEVSRLSSGEKQRLALVRALSVRPRALLLDEPTANLDGENTERVERWLKAIITEHGLPVLWVAHDPGQIERMARRHLRIRGERLEAAA